MRSSTPGGIVQLSAAPGHVVAGTADGQLVTFTCGDGGEWLPGRSLEVIRETGLLEPFASLVQCLPPSKNVL